MPFSADPADPLALLTRQGPALLFVPPQGEQLDATVLDGTGMAPCDAAAARLSAVLLKGEQLDVFRATSMAWVPAGKMPCGPDIRETHADPDGRLRCLLLSPLGAVLLARPGMIPAHVLLRTLHGLDTASPADAEAIATDRLLG